MEFPDPLGAVICKKRQHFVLVRVNPGGGESCVAKTLSCQHKHHFVANNLVFFFFFFPVSLSMTGPQLGAWCLWSVRSPPLLHPLAQPQGASGCVWVLHPWGLGCTGSPVPGPVPSILSHQRGALMPLGLFKGHHSRQGQGSAAQPLPTPPPSRPAALGSRTER